MIAAASTLSAQTAPASASTPAPAVAPAKASPTTAAAAPVEEKPVELSPFTVTSDDDQGYRAQNTLAGSRLNSALKDTPGVLDGLFAST